MRLRVLLVTVVVLALVAAYFATRETPRTDGAVDLARADVAASHANRVDLATPAETDSVASRATALETQPAEVARPSWAEPWTGVRVRVVAVETGSPIRRAEVRAAGPTAPLGWTRSDGHRAEIGESARTDADGFVDLALEPAAEYRIVAQAADGGASNVVALERPLRMHEVRELTIKLPTMPDLVFHGRVIDRETGAPIAGARAGRTKVWREIEPDDAQITDADGRFRIEAWSWRGGSVSVIANGYEYAWTPLGWSKHSTPVGALEITLSRVGSARLTVLDRNGGALEGVRVTFSTRMHNFGQPDDMRLLGAGWPDEERIEATTDARGVAVFAELPPRMPLAGIASAGGKEVFRATDPLTLEPGEARELEWRIGSGCTIRGVAREMDGAPAADLTIWLESAGSHPHPIDFEAGDRDGRRRTETGPDGRFAFDDVGPGAWWLGPAPEPEPVVWRRDIERDEVAPHARVVRIEPGDSAVDVEIRVQRGLSIEGHVVDSKGSPVSTPYVRYTRVSDGVSGGARSYHLDSRFLIGPIEDGEYELRASSAGGHARSQFVRARPGDKDVVLRLRAGAIIRGSVVDGHGSPVEAELHVRHLPFDMRDDVWPSRAQRGRFEVRGLDPGPHDIVARSASGLFGIVRDVDVAEGGTREVRVQLERGSRLRVRFEGPWPRGAVTILAGDAPVLVDGIERGTEDTLVVPAGALVIRAQDSAGGPGFDLAVTTKAGETRELVFDGAWK